MTSLSELAQGQQYPAAALYVVATPIGNVADITLRALHVLGLVDRIAAEDTRNTGQLLARYGISKPLVAVHQHNERAAAQRIVEHLQAGERVAYVSDAGTPGISDPGAKLVPRRCKRWCDIHTRWFSTRPRTGSSKPCRRWPMHWAARASC
jgi:16S rRNA (cytidine1402-2'-O)-methyltransferase